MAWTLTIPETIFAPTNKIITMNIEKQLGAAIVKIRRGKYISQESLSQRTGISRHYISEIENGNRQVSISIINRIAVTLGVSLSYIFKEAGV